MRIMKKLDYASQLSYDTKVFHLMVYDITLMQKISILCSIWHAFQLNVMGIWRQCYELNCFYLRKQIQYITYFQQA